MTRRRPTSLVATLAIATLLAACSAGASGSPGASSGSPGPSTTGDPSGSADPSPNATSTPDPVAPIRLELPVSVSPSGEVDVLEEPAGGTTVTTLTTADTATALMGPLILDGANWYLVAGTGTQWTGWVPAEQLTAGVAPDESTSLITLDGRGSGDADSATVEAGVALVARAMAVPMEGRESCEIEITVAGVDGAHVAVNEVTEVTEATEFLASGLDDETLRQSAAGQVSMQVRSDCTFAASLDALPL